ncbi:hypothetical protein FB45DRAFT_1067635 [Roridomyces roridus]|uniref:Uncharacterized protein n=1 Tax=Roridomyces roridus TaxID=1738132 RepID=A0AAD7FAA9_9AGAR|nr:hypothetical protein FB45DRAFT_1067635 [Roridomyces roridus]
MAKKTKDWPIPSIFFRTAYNLVDLGVGRHFRPASFISPASQLTHYCADASWTRHQEILRICPSLVKAYINVHPASVEWRTPSGEAIDLPHLRCVYISHIEPLEYLRMPHLHQATLDFSTLSDCTISPAVQYFLTNSSHNVQRLGLRGLRGGAVAKEILRSHSRLTELVIMMNFHEVDAHDVSCALIDVLNVNTAEDTVVLPGLSCIHIAFEAASLTLLDNDLYIKMLEYRWKMQPRVLEAATLCFECGPWPESNARLEALCCDGLDFTLAEVGNVLEFMAYEWLCRPKWMM